MRIILVGGPHHGEHHENVGDDCLRFHRGHSFYQLTDEMTGEGRRIFKYAKEASEKHQPNPQ